MNKEQLLQVITFGIYKPKTPQETRREEKNEGVREAMKKGDNGSKVTRTESGAGPNGNNLLD